jgi:hypothetical protein
LERLRIESNPNGLAQVMKALVSEVFLSSRFKVQHLLSANNSLGPHLLVKSQRFIQFRVGKLLRVRCTRPKFTCRGGSKGPCFVEISRYQKKKKKKDLELSRGCNGMTLKNSKYTHFLTRNAKIINEFYNMIEKIQLLRNSIILCHIML